MDHYLKLPISSNELLKQLDEWKIIYKHFTHEPLVSVNESKLLQEKLFGNNKGNGHIKNLYLRDKKKNNILFDTMKVEGNLIKRDKTDSERKIAPLKKPKDAFEIDTSKKSELEVFNIAKNYVDTNLKS